MNFKQEEHRIYLEDEHQAVIAEVTFPAESDDTVNIDHTFVDDSLRGQGVAGQLLLAAAEYLRKNGKKAVPSCSYAVNWFEKHPEYCDVLKKL